jgi:hypothetical protein
MESFRFPSLSALGEYVILKTSDRYEAIQHQAELNPAKQWKRTVRDKKGERFIYEGYGWSSQVVDIVKREF